MALPKLPETAHVNSAGLITPGWRQFWIRLLAELGPQNLVAGSATATGRLVAGVTEYQQYATAQTGAAAVTIVPAAPGLQLTGATGTITKANGDVVPLGSFMSSTGQFPVYQSGTSIVLLADAAAFVNRPFRVFVTYTKP